MSVAAAVQHLLAGQWEQAHALVQDDESTLGCWAHAIVHLQEGDDANARYWFTRAGRRFSTDVESELSALANAAKQEP